ncbi:MAG: hypothetical protein ACLU9N_00195 [Clostridia bacterium]
MKISEGTFLKELEKKNPLAIEFIVREYGALVKSVIDRYLRGNRQRKNGGKMNPWKN